MSHDYDGQARGALGDYARYLAGMDASMQQKVALTAAHLLCEGRVADLGCGSGAASDAFAALYPRLEVFGVDISDTMVALASQRFSRPNLRFVVGDASQLVFGERALDGVLASSMLHHVTSFSDYDHDAARRAIEAQAAQLKEHGVLVVRDFVDPGPGEVLLDLLASDGDDSDDPRSCSTARLFERFSRDFRSLHDEPGFALTREAASAERVREGFVRFRTTHKLAAEFLLRKDYRDDWEAEAKEEYTYFTQAQFEDVFVALGLRVLASTPIWNPWIVKHRLVGKAHLQTLDGKPLPLPPTNYVIAGERVAETSGVSFRVSLSDEAPRFLSLERFVDGRDGRLRDLVRRPNATLDAVPWFEHGDAVYVLVRTSYPRPIVTAEPALSTPLDGSRACPWSVEPLAFLQGDRPEAETIEAALASYAGIAESDIVEMEEGSRYYPSPGGVAERVSSYFVRVAPTFQQLDVGARSGFSSSGRVVALDAAGLLRAAHVGGVSDARVELNVYDLLARLGRSAGPWLGEALDVPESPAPSRISTLDELLHAPKRRVFRQAQSEEVAAYLSIKRARFEEVDKEGAVVSSQCLEYVVPTGLSAVTVALAVLRRSGGVVYLGVDDDDLPAAQCFEGRSNLVATPAWRLPRESLSLSEARDFASARLRGEHGVTTGPLALLGGKYHPTPGATPEVVHILAGSVVSEVKAPRTLHWVRLDELAARAKELKDTHLRVVALRAAHALRS